MSKDIYLYTDKEDRINELNEHLKLNKSYLRQHYDFIGQELGIEFSKHIKDAIRNIIMIENNYRDLHMEKSKLQLQIASHKYRMKQKLANDKHNKKSKG